MPTIIIGINNETNIDLLTLASRDMAANINPMNKLPVSPKKIVAGLKLYRKNPRHDPASASKTAAEKIFPIYKQIKPTVRDAIRPKPGTYTIHTINQIKAFITRQTKKLSKQIKKSKLDVPT